MTFVTGSLGYWFTSQESLWMMANLHNVKVGMGAGRGHAMGAGTQDLCWKNGFPGLGTLRDA